VVRFGDLHYVPFELANQHLSQPNGAHSPIGRDVAPFQRREMAQQNDDVWDVNGGEKPVPNVSDLPDGALLPKAVEPPRHNPGFVRRLQDKDGHAIQTLSETPDLVTYHALGGGFIQTDKPLRVFQRYNVEYRPIWRRIYVSADWMDDTVKAWGNGEDWNGFAQPRFELPEALELQKSIPDLSWHDLSDSFSSYDGELHVYPGQVILVDGQAIKVYQIGEGWCWDHMAPPQTEDLTGTS
jgi:hypothetical protein